MAQDQMINFSWEKKFWDCEASYGYRQFPITSVAKKFLHDCLTGNIGRLVAGKACKNCDGDLSLSHLFWRCRAAAEVWEFLNFRSLKLDLDTFPAMFAHLRRDPKLWDDRRIGMFVSVCLALWEGRTATVVPASVIARASKELAYGLQEQRFLDAMDKVVTLPAKVRTWRKPPFGFFKINIAARSVRKGSSMAMAAVLRSFDGGFVGGMVELLPCLGGKKLEGISLSLRSAFRWCLTDLHLSGSAVMVEINQGSIFDYMMGRGLVRVDLAPYCFILDDCQLMSKEFAYCHYSCCREDANWSAWNLTERVEDWDFQVGSWFSSPPCWMKEDLKLDNASALVPL